MPSRITLLCAALLLGLAHSPAQPGTFDTTFFDQGILTVLDPGYSLDANALLVRPDGSWITIGQRRDGFGANILMMAYRADGRPDSSFGAGNTPLGPTWGPPGIVRTDLPGVSSEDGRTGLLMPDGRLWIGGACFPQGGLTFQSFLARYHADGRLDSTLGGVGYLIDSAATYNEVLDMHLLADGGLLVLRNTGVTRYDSTGTPDTGFGTLGVAAVGGFDMVVDAAGYIYVGAGESTTGTDGVVQITKLTPDGQVDGGFGSGGTVTASAVEYPDDVSLALTPDGKVLVAVDLRTNGGLSPSLLLLQYLADGSPDSGFGSNGRTAPLPGLAARSLLVLPDGFFLVTGELNQHQKQDLAVAKFQPDGSRDFAFGQQGGYAVSGLATAPFAHSARGLCLAVQVPGLILAGGSAYVQGQFHLAVVRLLDAPGVASAIDAPRLEGLRWAWSGDSQMLRLWWSGEPLSDCRIGVYDMQGRLRHAAAHTAIDAVWEAPLPQLASGVYVLRVQAAGYAPWVARWICD
ncbi:MAG: hypothetical protein OHK0039_09660 [Bacteroidia bacterium]